MTDNEIIKFVEHAMYSAKGEDGFKEIHWEHFKDILDLINRLKAKNKEFDEKIVIQMGAIDWQVKEINRQKAENEDLFYKLQGVMLSVDKWLEGVELEQDEVNRAATMREKTLRITEEQQAEIERLTTELEQKTEMMANLGVEFDKAQKNADIHLDHVRFLQKELKKFQHIESTIDEFWDGLQKLSMYKGKEKPSLEELLEYIEQVKDEAVIEFAKTLNDTSEDCTGKGYPYVLCKDIDRIADDWTGGAFKKVKHSSLCETETYEGVTDTNVGGKKNDFKE
jgi:hypothetical protein